MPSIPRPYFDPDDPDAEPADPSAAGEPDGEEDDVEVLGATDGAADDDDALALGDGAPDGAATVWCPYCGEASEVAVDPGGGELQEYVEDCPVCCRPWRVTVSYDADGHAAVWARTDDE